MKFSWYLFVFLIISFVVYSNPQYLEIYEKRTGEIRGKNIRIFGNKILSKDKIYEILKYDGREISKYDMDLSLRRLEKYYISKGYDLVKITYMFLMDEWYIFINEGRIGKIIIKGENTLNTLLLKSAFIFDQNIYNSTDLKNIIERVKKIYGIKRIQYRLLKIDGAKKSLLGLTEKFSGILQTESAESYIEPEYDLLIIVKKKEWGDGFGGFITYNSMGLVSGISYSDGSIIISNDRFKSVIKGGINTRSNISTNESTIVFTIGALDLIYYPSFLRFRYFKPSIESITSDVSYQRSDLLLNEYRLFSEDFSIYAGFEIKKNMILSYGFGEEYLYAHSFDYVVNSEKDINEIRLFRSYLSLTMNYLIAEPNLRNDLQENLKAKLRYYIPSDNQSHWLFSSDYTKSIIFGYDYMKIATGFKMLTGDIPFFDEFSIAYSSFKSSFSDSYYARDAYYLGIEYDLSLYKDILHIDFFSDFTLFYYKNYNHNNMYWLGAIDTGGGVRFLIFDMFLLKIDYALAFAFNSDQDDLFLFSINKVF